MSNCIWVKQYMRQGTLVREHQRCYSRPLSKADKDLYDEVKRKEQEKWDDFDEAAEDRQSYRDLVADAKQRNSPLLPTLLDQSQQADKAANKKFDDWAEQYRKAKELEKELGIEDDPDKKQVVTPTGLVIDDPPPATPSPISGKPKPASRKLKPNAGKGPKLRKPKTGISDPRRGRETRKKKKKGWLW